MGFNSGSQSEKNYNRYKLEELFIGYANRDTKDEIWGDMSPKGGRWMVTFGVLVALGGVAALGWWFYTTARARPRQPPKYPHLINIGLLTVLPTAAVWMMVTYVTLYGGSSYTYGPMNLSHLMSTLVAVYLVLYAVSRGNYAQAGQQLPYVLTMALFLAAGLAMVELGRQAQGKGFNDMVNSATVTGWKSIAEDSSLITIQYEMDNGNECQVSLEMDCTIFWQDMDRDYREEEGEAQGDDWYSIYANRHYWWDEKNSDDLILSEFSYSNPQYDDYGEESTIFTCRGGAQYGDNGNYNNYNQNNQYNYNNAYNYNQNNAQYNYNNQDDEDASWSISNILINSHTCHAGFYTQNARTHDYIYVTPERAMILCAIAAVAAALMLGSWKLCPNDIEEQEEDAGATGFVPAPEENENKQAGTTAAQASVV